MVNMRNLYPAFFILGAVFCCCFSFTCSAKLQKDQSSIIPSNSNEPKHSEAVLSPHSSGNLDNDVDDVDDINEADLETALKASDLSSLSVWSIVRGLWNWVKGDIAESLKGNAGLTTNADGRTFGKIRRLQMALIPIIFKFGVLSAMVAFLVVLGLKSLFLLKVLVLMNAAVILGKFLTFKTHFGGVEHAAPQQWTGYSNWSPHIMQSWSGSAPASNVPQNKEIHLHIHGAQSQPQVSSYTSYNAADNNGGWQNRNDAYSAYEPTAAASDQNAQIEVKNAVPMSITPTQYPTNHLTY